MANPPLPDGSNSAEILQQVVRKTYNKRVKDWFQDVDVVDELDLSIARHAAYAACKHDDNDSLIQTVSRQLLFTELRDRLTGGDIGTDAYSHQVLRALHPQIFLFFKEDQIDVEPGYRAVEAKISFRLMGHDSSITKSQLTTYANRIKNAFNTPTDQLWRKGKVMVSYVHWEEGYQLQLLCRDKSEGKGLVNRILDIQSHSPDWSKLTVNENDSPSTAFPTIPPNAVVLGETRRLPRRRPIADVRFHWAIARLGDTRIIQPLVDRSGKFSDVLVEW